MTPQLRSPRSPRDRQLPLLGGLTPTEFLRRHWQKKPLLIRAAFPGFEPLLSRARLFALATKPNVESRLIVRTNRGGWTLAHGPFRKSALPSLRQPNRTLLVQGVDLHSDAAHELLQSFRFVPDARLDDLMISWASAGGGVGPHVDSYDVFLLQAQGPRRWRIGRTRNPQFESGVPLKILRRFVAAEEHVLEPGDMLYLPPGWGHDGVAEGECMTYSIGFRAPRRGALAADLVRRLADDHDDELLYADAGGARTRHPAAIPAELQAFAAAAVNRLVAQPREIACALGEALTEPKAGVAFDEPETHWQSGTVVLDRRTRMLYDGHHLFINGDSYRAAGRDARFMHRLADERCLDAHAVRAAGSVARSLLAEWFAAGWLHLR
jgi:50S ribosomal protein L16 3-hydroxylase